MDERLERFMEQARLVRDSYPDVRALCRAEKAFIDQAYSTDASRKTRLTRYRNALRQEGLTKYFLKQLRLPKVRAQQLRQDYDTFVVSRGSTQQPIHSYHALIDKALWCVGHSSYAVVLNGLALLSGRRPFELCVIGDFDGDDASLPPRHIWFRGQAKTRNEERASDDFVIPVLCDTESFIEAHWRFQGMKDFSACNPEVSGPNAAQKFKQYGAQFGEAYQKHFAALMPPDTTVRHLRDAYALIAYATCRSPESHIAINLYLRNILGHSDAKGQTAQSYQKFYLSEFPPPQWEL